MDLEQIKRNNYTQLTGETNEFENLMAGRRTEMATHVKRDIKGKHHSTSRQAVKGMPNVQTQNFLNE